MTRRRGAMAVGVVAALPAEARALAAVRVRLGDTHFVTEHVAVRLSGVGPDAARLACEALLADGAGALISWGIAAGLDAMLIEGTVVLADRVIVAASPTTSGPPRAGPACNSLLSWSDDVAAELERGEEGIRVSAVRGTIVCPGRVLRSAADKAAWALATGAVAADMESAAVAAAATRADVPWITVRAVADRAGASVPTSAVESIGSGGQFAWSPFIAALARHPSEVRALLRLARAYRTALQSLRAVARLAGQGFLAPPGLVPGASQQAVHRGDASYAATGEVA